uniref:Uncharacterized protein n=1 Tax=Arundo donax TaxID=35708 RepID=A0A0A9GDI8_ARUDO
MYPSQVLKHGERPDPSPGTVHKVPPVSPWHENSFTHFFHPKLTPQHLRYHPSHHDHQRIV